MSRLENQNNFEPKRLISRLAMAGLFFTTSAEAAACNPPPNANTAEGSSVATTQPVVPTPEKPPPAPTAEKPQPTAAAKTAPAQAASEKSPVTKTEKNGTSTTVTHADGSVDTRDFIPSRTNPNLKDKPQVTFDGTFPKGLDHREVGSLRIGITPAYWLEPDAKAPGFLFVIAMGGGDGSLVRSNDDKNIVITLEHTVGGKQTLYDRIEPVLASPLDRHSTNRLAYDWGNDKAWRIENLNFDNKALDMPRPNLAKSP